MENTDEKLENIEQILELLIGQMKTQEEKLSFLVQREEISISDPGREILLETENIPTVETIEVLNSTLEKLAEKINELPKAFVMKHHHNFDIKSKSYAIGTLVTLIVVALSVGTSFFLVFRNKELSAESDKFRVIRGNYPDLANDIDAFYLKDRDGVMKDADAKIIQYQSLLEAKGREIEAKKEYEKAKTIKKRLSQKSNRKQ